MIRAEELEKVGGLGLGDLFGNPALAKERSAKQGGIRIQDQIRKLTLCITS